MNTEIKLQTFDQLLTSVLVDFRTFEEEGMIEPATLIKVAQEINYELGLRIHQTKETIVQVQNHVAKLPEDFYVLHFAFLVGKWTEASNVDWSGRVTENVTACSGVTSCGTGPQYCNFQYCLAQPTDICTPEQDPFNQNRVYSMCDGAGIVKVLEHRGLVINEYTDFRRLHVKTPKYLDPGTINPDRRYYIDEAEIKNGYLYLTSRPNQKVYLSYLGALEDENGNLLVLDHPKINMYYEAALKCRILENLYFAGEEVEKRLERAEANLNKYKLQAHTIVNMPNFSELLSTWKQNRRLQYDRYYNYWRTNVFEARYGEYPGGALL